ncbi:5-formyltetrahydrofolate cyclo-ligase [Nocardioides yefusunii]|uniref:5-formyltetrahydrofolate cyclo-ligase n=1 Tax=Nocardioides yefusunii TaxID=2500546 RepID=A0ABW1R0L0_9ACTN|nr:5-formyltetrahydrofolate cyclo-ligase [Nocardioides yefusunii]
MCEQENGPDPRSGDAVAERKRDLRERLLTARRHTPQEVLDARAASLGAHVLAIPEVAFAGTVAAYVSMGTEPPTDAVLAALHARGAHVLLPVLLGDNDLDWAPYEGPDSLRDAGRGLREPATTPLGVDAVASADVVLVPGLAVSADGVRMGRGGGSYDRALARVGENALRVLLLHPDEIDQDVPAAPHDQRVDVVVSAEGVVRFTA